MKKIAIVLALFMFVGVVGLFAQDTLTVDLSKLTAVKNEKAFTRNYDIFGIPFPANLFPANTNWSNFNRVVVRVKAFSSSGRELRDSYGQIICSIFYEGNPSNWDAAPSVFNAGPNVPLKADNLGSDGPAPVSKEGTGARITLTKAPGGIMLQNGSETVKYLELLEVTFFKQ